MKHDTFSHNQAAYNAHRRTLLLLAAAGTSSCVLFSTTRVAHAAAPESEAHPEVKAEVPGVVGTNLATAATASFQNAGATVTEDVSTAKAPEQSALSRSDTARVRAELNAMLDDNDELAPALVGIAWLASSSYDASSNNGGSDSGSAAALAERKGGDALDAARVALQQLGGQYPVISASDLVTLAGVVAVEHMGGPCVKWRPGRLGLGPEGAIVGTKAVDSQRSLNVDRCITGLTLQVRSDWAAFSDREMVALIGGLAVCKGYPTTGSNRRREEWSRSPASFTNEYFRDLVGSSWTLTHHDGPDQFENGAGGSVMHMEDMVLLWDKRLRKHVEEFAKNEDVWFEAFAEAFQKLEENGVAGFKSSTEPFRPWYKFW